MNKLEILTQIKTQRMAYAFEKILNRGLNPQMSDDHKYIRFIYKGKLVKINPFSGYFSGKNIKDGRGVENLLNQLK